MHRALLLASASIALAGCVFVELDELYCYGFACSDGGCVYATDRCDGFVDCDDASVEAGCVAAPVACSGFQCSNGTCRPQTDRCDGITDCSDASDEAGCVAAPAACTGFTCGNGTCRAQTDRCDGIIDCSDSSDEAGCLPDLIVEDFSMNYEEQGSNRYLCINQTPAGVAMAYGHELIVRNQGSATVDTYDLKVGLQNLGSQVIYLFDGSYFPLAPHRAGTTVVWDDPYCAFRDVSTLPAGEYRTAVWVDYNDVVTESSEDNNISYSTDTRVIAAAAAPVSCTDTCRFAFDDECDDGGPGFFSSLCTLGTDCSDCGAR